MNRAANLARNTARTVASHRLASFVAFWVAVTLGAAMFGASPNIGATTAAVTFVLVYGRPAGRWITARLWRALAVGQAALLLVPSLGRYGLGIPVAVAGIYATQRTARRLPARLRRLSRTMAGSTIQRADTIARNQRKP